ncbi:MAG: hypothetical protein WBP02_04545, partial [Gammaproteobacteria bacterium]
ACRTLVLLCPGKASAKPVLPNGLKIRFITVKSTKKATDVYLQSAENASRFRSDFSREHLQLATKAARVIKDLYVSAPLRLI